MAFTMLLFKRYMGWGKKRGNVKGAIQGWRLGEPELGEEGAVMRTMKIKNAIVGFLKRAEGLDAFDYKTNFSPFHLGTS